MSFRLYRECVGAVRLGNKISSPLAHSRYDDLYEAALLWQDDCFYGDWYLACFRALGHVSVLTEPWHYVMMLLPSQLLCNRPDKEERPLISAAQRLRTSPVLVHYSISQIPMAPGLPQSRFQASLR